MAQMSHPYLGLPHQAHSDTSRAAAASSLPGARTARERVYWTVCASAQGLTDEEIQLQLAMNPSTQRPRRVELLEAGLIEDSGSTRTVRSGLEAVVWRQRAALGYPQDWPRSKRPDPEPEPAVFGRLRDGTAPPAELCQVLDLLDAWWRHHARSLVPGQCTAMLREELRGGKTGKG